MRTLEFTVTRDEEAGRGLYHRLVITMPAQGAMFRLLQAAVDNGNREVRMLDCYYLVHNVVLRDKGMATVTLIRR